MSTEAIAELLEWAHTEIRELDELCRSMVPGYDPLRSEDMLRLAAMLKAAKTLREDA